MSEESEFVKQAAIQIIAAFVSNPSIASISGYSGNVFYGGPTGQTSGWNLCQDAWRLARQLEETQNVGSK